MSRDISVADIVVHLHPDKTADCRETIEQGLRAHEGVVSVHFNEEDHPHAVVVAYDPKVTKSATLLGVIRECDPDAVMASF